MRWIFWTLAAFLATASAQGADRLPPQVTVLEAIDVGDLLVMGNETVDVEVAADGQRWGPAVFGSLPFGSGRLRLLGEPGACVHVSAHRLDRQADSGRIRVTRVMLRGAGVRDREEIDLRLDAHGQAIVEVGVRLRLSDIRQSRRWRLSLSFEARYGEDCLY